MGSGNSKLVLAIEVGNDKSGFAFAGGNKKDSHIYTTTDDTNRKIGRIPTALLLKEDLSFDNFGFYAEEKYIYLSLKNEHSNYRFVNNIDIRESDDKLCKKCIMKDCRGNELEAGTVYYTIINHLLQMCLTQIKHHTKFENLEKSLIVTVPDSVSKELKDSIKSRIKDVKNVRFVRNSEAAAAYCISQQSVLDGETNTKKMQNGTSFIVVNFGSRFTSVFLQRMTSGDEYTLLDERIIETGGDYITDIFFEDIRERYKIGQNWNILKDDHFCDYMNLRRVFDNEKHKFNNTTECVLIEMPTSIMHLMIQNDNDSDESIVIKENKIIISQTTMTNYFKQSLTCLISTIQENVSVNKENIECVFLLGGYSKSPIVREIIEKGVKTKSVLVFEPDMGVLKGAVMLGFQEAEEIYGLIRPREEKNNYSIQIKYKDIIAYFEPIFQGSQLKRKTSVTCELELLEEEKGKPIVFYRINLAKKATQELLTEKEFEMVSPELQPRNFVCNNRVKVEMSIKENDVVFTLKELQKNNAKDKVPE